MVKTLDKSQVELKGDNELHYVINVIVESLFYSEKFLCFFNNVFYDRNNDDNFDLSE